MFLNHLYGGMDEPELKIIDVFICKLRRKIHEALGDDNCIETVWGRGYVLRDPLKNDSNQFLSQLSQNTNSKGQSPDDQQIQLPISLINPQPLEEMHS